jgi:hypothetical protein
MKFSKFCQALSNRAGSSKTFLTAICLIAVWAVTGPYFHFNDTTTDHQYIDDDHHVPDGLPDPEHPEPGQRHFASENR